MTVALTSWRRDSPGLRQPRLVVRRAGAAMRSEPHRLPRAAESVGPGRCGRQSDALAPNLAERLSVAAESARNWQIVARMKPKQCRHTYVYLPQRACLQIAVLSVAHTCDHIAAARASERRPTAHRIESTEQLVRRAQKQSDCTFVIVGTLEPPLQVLQSPKPSARRITLDSVRAALCAGNIENFPRVRYLPFRFDFGIMIIITN